MPYRLIDSRVPGLLLAGLLLTGALAPPLTHAVAPEWTMIFDDGSDESVLDMVVGLDGSAYVTGNSGDGLASDIRTIKYLPDGTQAWAVLFNGPGGSQDLASAITLDRDGNVIVVGRSSNPGSSSDFVTIKYRASDGQLIWHRLHDGPAGSIDQANAVIVSDANAIFVTGLAYNVNDEGQNTRR